MKLKWFDDELAAGRLDELLRKVKILYTDLDGTLLGRRGCLLVDGNNQPSARTANTIVAANLCDELTIVPVTGRSVTQLIEVSRLCDWNDFIAEVGAVRSYWHADKGLRENIYETPEWPDEVLRSAQDKRVPLKTPLDIINASGAMELLEQTFPGQVEYHSPWNVNRQATNVLRGRIDMARASELLATIEPAITLVENGIIQPSAHSLVASDEPIRAYHLTPTGASKATAIRADLAYRGIRREEALMIGDGLADLECAPEVAATIMVRNFISDQAMEELAALTPQVYVTRGARGDGWSELVHAILTALNSTGV